MSTTTSTSPGAINLPSRRSLAESVAVLDRGRPVIVYYWDAL